MCMIQGCSGVNLVNLEQGSSLAEVLQYRLRRVLVVMECLYVTSVPPLCGLRIWKTRAASLLRCIVGVSDIASRTRMSSNSLALEHTPFQYTT